MISFTGMTSKLNWWQVDHVGPLPSWTGQCFFLIGIQTYPGFRSAFLTYKASAQTTIHGLTKCLTHHHGILLSIASDQETNYTAKEAW